MMMVPPSEPSGRRASGDLVDFQRAEHFRREQREVETAVRRIAVLPDRLRNRMAVEETQVERRIGAVDAHALRGAECAIDGHARHLRQCFGDVGGGEFADVFGGDRFDDRIRIALFLERFLQTFANADDFDRAQFLIALRRRTAAGRLRIGRCEQRRLRSVLRIRRGRLIHRLRMRRGAHGQARDDTCGQ